MAIVFAIAAIGAIHCSDQQEQAAALEMLPGPKYRCGWQISNSLVEPEG
jgi:hypothetical protein